jgi:CheY-like chemotaxis protein
MRLEEKSSIVSVVGLAHDAEKSSDSFHQTDKVADTFMHRSHPRKDLLRKREVHWIVRDLAPVVPLATNKERLEGQSAETMPSTEQQKGFISKEGFSSRGGEERTEYPNKHVESDPAWGRGLQAKELCTGEKELRMEKVPHTRSSKSNKAEFPLLQNQGETTYSTEKAERPRVLVVEDNLLNQRVMTLTLERLGYAVDLAANGQEALFSLQRPCDPPYQVILMDCQMPELDGYQTTALIRQRFAKGLPIIGMSASHLEEDKQRALDVGMDDYLCKPVRQEVLARVLLAWCPDKSPLASRVGS